MARPSNLMRIGTKSSTMRLRGNEQVIASNFWMGLPEESELRDSLTMWPPEDMHQLMRRIEEYKRLKDDRLQGNGKALASSQFCKEYHPEKF